jgi:hypothetical protein
MWIISCGWMVESVDKHLEAYARAVDMAVDERWATVHGADTVHPTCGALCG